MLKDDAYGFPVEPEVIIYETLNFQGLDSESVFYHAHKVEDLALLFMEKGTSLPLFMIKLFPSSLGGGAKIILNNSPPMSIKSFKDMIYALVGKYMSDHKQHGTIREIHCFLKTSMRLLP